MSRVCRGWLLETEPDDIDYFYDQKYWYYEGGIYDPTDTVFDTCDLAPYTNLSVAHTRGARDKEGCFFKFVHLGYAKTPDDCRRFCEGRALSLNCHRLFYDVVFSFVFLQSSARYMEDALHGVTQKKI